jgi:hypothetical protein
MDPPAVDKSVRILELKGKQDEYAGKNVITSI